MKKWLRYTTTLTTTFVFTVLLTACGGGSSAATPNSGGSGSTATTGSATLSWTPPDKNTDNTDLTDLDGYKIYYGTSQTSLDNSIVLDNSYNTATSYEVTNLTVGITYYFAITAVNSSNVESGYSNISSKKI